MKNQLKTIALLGGLAVLIVGIGAMLGPTWMYGALALAIVLNAGAYFFSDRIVLAMHRAQPIERHDAPWLHDMVEELAERAELSMPRICIIPESQPNAFATGRNPEHGVVAVTEGILQILSRRELRGVLAHELAHIKNRDILVSSIAAVVAAAVTYLAHALSFIPFIGLGGDDEDGPSPIGSLVIVLFAPVLATLIQLGISRSREYLADETGGRICGDPEALASALLKLERGAAHFPASAEPATASLFIVNPLAGVDGVMRLFATHPSTEDRVRRLKAQAGMSAGPRAGALRSDYVW